MTVARMVTPLSTSARPEIPSLGAGALSADSRLPVHRQIFEIARERPEAPAVEQDGRIMTYGELASRAHRLARYLRPLGAGPEMPVALGMRPSFDLIVAVVAILESGSYYLPLDLDTPAERLAFLLQDSSVPLMVCDSDLLSKLPEAVLARIRAVHPDRDQDSIDELPTTPLAPSTGTLRDYDLAYAIYTSGSTGRPKGTLVRHVSLAHYIHTLAEELGLTDRDRVLQFASISFDASVEEIFIALTRGATLVLKTVRLETAEDFLARCRRDEITVLDLPTAWWHEICRHLQESDEAFPPRVRTVILGGEEALLSCLRSWWTTVGREVRLLNTYGPTEATIAVTCSDLSRWRPDAATRLPIGHALPGISTCPLDRRMLAVAPGQPGELHLGGACLARGYLERPRRCAQSFVPNPWAVEPGRRLYKTGDLVRLLPDGQLEFLGRVDHQVQIRGFRVELGEIETVLANHPAIHEAAVQARREAAAEHHLVAWFSAVDHELDPASLVPWLEQHLPAYMVPAFFERLNALPKTTSGKIDRQALTRRSLARPTTAARQAVEAPRGETETIIGALFEDLLGVPSVGRKEDFFRLGGHSILAGQLIARLRRQFRAELSVAWLFDHPTPAALAREVETRRAGSGLSLPALTAVPREGPLRLSFAQERLWLHDQLEPASNAFNIGEMLRLRGVLRPALLEAALWETLRRHEILRTRIETVAGKPQQRIDPPPAHALPRVDLSGLPPDRRLKEARRLAKPLESRPFDLARGPLQRAVLLRLDHEEHVFCLVLHHIIFDGWSSSILLREIATLYRALAGGEASPLPELTVQYADFAAWQRSWQKGEHLSRQLTWWQDTLNEINHPSAVVPTDRPSHAAGGPAGHLKGHLPREVLAPLRRIGGATGTTLFMTLLAALGVLAWRYTGQPRLRFGSMHANRGHQALESMIGFFVNILPLAVRIDPEGNFRQALAEVRRLTLGAYTHQDAPYEKVLERVSPGKAAARNSIFQMMILYQNVPETDNGLPGIDAEVLDLGPSQRRAGFDLSWIFVPTPAKGSVDESIEVVLEFDRGLFEPPTARRLFDHFRTLLEEVGRDPDRPIAKLLRDEDTRNQSDGTLWLTDPAIEDQVPAPEQGPETTAQASQAAGLKAATVRDRVASRRSKLSGKQLALLHRRLKK